MNTKKFIKDYRKYLEKNFNAERAVQEKRYLYSDLKHYGLSVWKITAYAKSLKPQIMKMPKPQLIQLVKTLWAQPSHEEKSLALDVLTLRADDLTVKDMPLIEKLMRESRGWALLDGLIIPLMPFILAKDRTAYRYLKIWIKDNDFWVRRSALLAQLLLFRKGVGGDKNLFFKLAESQFDEGWIDKVYTDTLTRSRARFFIRKAIGWTLREMSIKDPQSVRQFLTKNKSKMSGLSFREGSRRLKSTRTKV
ncbi:MAG TPA: DNA alkylation repair protein [Patescibacteria group bacterium]|nr:DNA alkylation repair protein [Patescibacteria group bacterium]